MIITGAWHIAGTQYYLSVQSCVLNYPASVYILLYATQENALRSLWSPKGNIRHIIKQLKVENYDDVAVWCRWSALVIQKHANSEILLLRARFVLGKGNELWGRI